MASWIDFLSRATAVILPILPGKLSPSGLSAYLVSMALGKCVIITDSPATRGLIDRGEAVIVPPRDVDALRDAVVRIANDDQYRRKVAAKGHRYALSLEDEARLARDIRRHVHCLLQANNYH
jgi:glycosyltransferase involved in cell wall biosynthesis